jgi:hypothetical protein
MVNIIKKVNKYKFFEICAEYEHLENMRWLLKNKFPFDEETFSNAAINGNLRIMKLLLKNKIPFDDMAYK